MLIVVNLQACSITTTMSTLRCETVAAAEVMCAYMTRQPGPGRSSGSLAYPVTVFISSRYALIVSVYMQVVRMMTLSMY